jgi:hypothetical protein
MQQRHLVFRGSVFRRGQNMKVTLPVGKDPQAFVKQAGTQLIQSNFPVATGSHCTSVSAITQPVAGSDSSAAFPCF